MINVKDSLTIPLDHLNDGMVMVIYSNSSHTNNFIEELDAERYNESRYQVFEGRNYWYKLLNSSDWKISTEETNGVFGSIAEGLEGRFSPNTFVGTMQVPFKNQVSAEIRYVPIEVRSSKISYEKGITDDALNKERSEYQTMLDQIAEQSIDLVMQYNVPVVQSFESGLELIDEKQLYQRFIFVKSLFKNQEFEEAVQKIITNPSTRWVTTEEDKDVRSIRRFTSKNVRELISRPNRMVANGIIPGIDSVPIKIQSSKKVESVDTPENRFVKHVLETFLTFIEDVLIRLKDDKSISERNEVTDIQFRLENLLNQSFFKEVGRANSLKINSPVLQRRSGYRELLRAWLRFHLTAQLSWNLGKNEIFSGGKKDIATLYEYWVFFALFKAIESRYASKSELDSADWISRLIVPNATGLELKLQEGKKLAFEFLLNTGKRNLSVKFYYNRTFTGGRVYEKHKGAGSYTKSFRPDYTISIWPSEMKESDAEAKEAIVHIHFDAKYKVEYLENWKNRYESVTDDQQEELNAIAESEMLEEESAERRGTYKNVDLYKMHAYKDAIRRTGGAYILYPGNDNDIHRFHGYHEVIPGVGAFSLRPSNQTVSSKNIGEFIDEIIFNLEDVLSQRELLAKRKYEIIKEKPIDEKSIDEELYAVAREIGLNENIHDTYVLVGYCKQGSSHYNWITEKNKYNIRFGNGYEVDGKMASAKFLILYELNGSEVQFKNDALYRLSSIQTRLISKDDLLNKEGYPTVPSEVQYLLYSIEETLKLGDYKFEFGSLYNDEMDSMKPFVISMVDLLRIREKI
jgi:predicted component of viral defense system (DUF524 family)